MLQPEVQSPIDLSPPSSAWWKSPGGIALGIAGGLGLLALITLFARPIALLFLAMCIAAAMSPVVARLSSRIPRNRAIVLIYLGVLVFVAVLIAVLIPPLVAQVRELGQRLPELLDRGRLFLEQNNIESPQTDTLVSQVGQVVQRVIAVPFVIFSGAFDVVLLLIVSLYLFIDAPGIRRFILSLFPPASRDHIDSVTHEMAQVAGGYIRGVVINILLVSTITTLGLTLIGVPFALVLGVLAGLFEALPVVGSLIAGVPIILVALVQSPATAVITIIFVITLQVVQGNVIAPNVMKGQAEVPQFVVPLAILAGAGVGGILGALIAVPVVAVVRVFLLRVVAPFIRQRTGAADEQTGDVDAAA
jgi:predicted PurR-regulated permease PerM